MRSVLALGWLVLLLGVATYVRWYVPVCFGNESCIGGEGLELGYCHHALE